MSAFSMVWGTKLLNRIFGIRRGRRSLNLVRKFMFYSYWYVTKSVLYDALSKLVNIIHTQFHSLYLDSLLYNGYRVFPGGIADGT
jgi:hypothetical protein